MFDWIVFDPSRLTLSDAVNARREKKDKAAVNSLAFVIRTVGTALVIIGALMAIITA